ncbi:hypothetical protein U9M48_021762 [Paspalum notatum var. saurae]|uniref:Uncharacterized protein n=1 Tax=Paspalum notatum var. saurae TaxID=547442 RepID=A0AAQ3TI82_PASNO
MAPRDDGLGPGNVGVPRDEAAPTPEQEPRHRGPAPDVGPAGPMPRVSAFQLMLIGATAIIGAAAAAPAPAPLPRLFFALLAWLVGCLSLFMSRRG